MKDSKELLEILICPETHTALKLADETVIEKINDKIDQRLLKTVGGDPVLHPLESGLIREDSKRVYPVKNGIPVLLTEFAIELD